jgi:signal transduction histidine kinase
VPRRLHWPAILVATVVAVVAASAWMGPLWSINLKIAAPTALFAGALIAAGAILWAEPSQAPASICLVLAGCLWPLGWTNPAWGGPWPLIAILISPLALVLIAWSIYRYPDPRQVGPRERAFLAALTLWILIGRSAVVLTSYPSRYAHPDSSWWPTLYADHGLNEVLRYASAGGQAVLAVPFLVQWLWRVRRVRGLDRQLMVPVVVAALIAGTTSAATPVAKVAGLPEPVLDVVLAIQATLLLSVPVAFALAALRRRLTSIVIADMVEQLRGEPTPEHVERALQHVLADPDLRVYYWSPDLDSHVDRDGRVFDGTLVEDSLLLPVTSADDEPLAVIRAERALEHHPELVAAAVSVGALAVQNARLQVATRAQLAQVRASHTRIIEAALTERQVLAQGLHSGALSRILALIEDLSPQNNPVLAQMPQIADTVRYATEQLTQVAGELQDLAGGLHPSVLSHAGLAEAVARMCAAQPLPMRVNLPPRRFPLGIEVAAYYVISEALTNVIRHAQASHVSVKGIHRDGGLQVTIEDDGCGGADVDRGTGLSGLRERLQALDGDLALISPPGQGTTLTAVIPCE